jgi:hypothetical protein
VSELSGFWLLLLDSLTEQVTNELKKSDFFFFVLSFFVGKLCGRSQQAQKTVMTILFSPKMRNPYALFSLLHQKKSSESNQSTNSQQKLMTATKMPDFGGTIIVVMERFFYFFTVENLL